MSRMNRSVLSPLRASRRSGAVPTRAVLCYVARACAAATLALLVSSPVSADEPSLLVITFSFVPVFTLQAQEGRLFAPLAFTKTYSMAAAAGLAVTLIPVLMGYLIRGQIPAEERNPINRFLVALYRPLLEAALRRPKTVLLAAIAILAATLWPMNRLGGEF